MMAPVQRKALRLIDLVDLPTLQEVQDRFARVVGVSTVIRDADGQRVTRVSEPKPLCERIGANPELRERCRQSHLRAIREAAATGQPTQYECHAGLVQIAAPILLDGQCLGTVVMGDRPKADWSPADRADLAAKLGLSEAEFQRQIAQMTPWSDEHMRQAADLLRLIASTITLACYREAQLRRLVDELTTLYEVSRLMTAKTGLQALLDTITRAVVRVLDVKASSLRLLDPTGTELRVASVANLSASYLNKGPVIVSHNEIDQLALAGQVVTVPDVRTDPRVLYREQARLEGLCSALVVGLRSGDRALGTLRLYSAEPRQFTDDEVRLLVAIANQAAAAIENATLEAQRRQKEEMDREVSTAARIQMRLLPDRVPQGDNFEMAVHYRPCYQLGGDYYDFIPFVAHNLGIAIGDVCGKSLPAAILMASVRAALRAHVENLFRVADIIARLNHAIYQDTRSEYFITLCYGVLDADGRRLTYTNAGHCPPLLVRAGQATALTRGGLVLGVQRQVAYEQEPVDLQPGDVVVFYTDGITESRAPGGELYGQQRLTEAALRLAGHSAAEILAGLRQSVDDFTGYAPPIDDRTLIVLKMR